MRGEHVATRRVLFAVLIVGLCLGGVSGTQGSGDQAEVQLRVDAVCVSRDRGGDHWELRVFTREPGTCVDLALVSTGPDILGLVDDQTKLSLADSGGTELPLVEDAFGGWSAQSNRDHTMLAIDVRSEKLPQRGAEFLRLRGEIVFETAEIRKTEVTKKVVLKKGTSLKAGPVRLSIEDVSKSPKWRKEPLEVTFRTKDSLRFVKKIRFLDGDGKEIPSLVSGSGSKGWSGDKTYDVSYCLKKEVDEVDVEVTYWTDTKQVRLPVDQKIGVGL